MKKNEIKVNGHYTAKISGNLVTVRVDSIDGHGSKEVPTKYRITNLNTGRKTTFRSAAKFRAPVADKKTPGIGGQYSSPATTECPKLSQSEQRRVKQIESKYSTEKGATEEERQEAQDILESSDLASKFNKSTTAKQPKFKFPPTDEQQSILDLAKVINSIDGVHAEIVDGKIVIMIEAGAGTGKTATLEMLGAVLEGNGQYTAFNSSLVAESKEKFQGTRVACNTTHSLGFRAEGKRFAHRLGGQRVRAIEVARMLHIEEMEIEDESGDKDKNKKLSQGFLASQVLGAIRRFCQSADREITANHFRYMDGLDNPSEDGKRTYKNNEKVREYLLGFAKKAWKDLSSEEGTLPFVHDHYVKVWQLNKPIIAADYILLDEAQDTAPVMLDILSQQVDLGTPVILVGDSAQQIYEWRGAVNALAAFPGAPRRFLSQSFRFGEAIAEVANQILESLSEPTELRLKGLESIPSRVAEVENPVAILCRTNAMAVATLLGAIADGKKPFLVGGGSDVISFVSAAKDLQEGKSTSHPDLACFSSWSEVEEYSQLDEGEDLRLMVKLIKEFGAESILSALKNMPLEKNADLVISTAHKSKGREWESVRLAADFPTLSKSDDSDLKLLYVAVTRAQVTLDISQCPFFTGNDAMDVTKAIASQPKPSEENIQSVVAAAPSTPPSSQEFTWNRIQSDKSWGVRGPKGMKGKTVDVVRKNGSVSSKKLLEVVYENGESCLYRV